MRVFIAVKFPTKILMEIKNIQENLPSFSGKKTELKNLHLTLKFLGEISSEKLEEIKSRLRKIKFNKFESEIKDVGFFDKKERGIIWLGISGCENLQRKVDDSLVEIYEKENRFMGHLTIARARKIPDKKGFIENMNKIKTHKMFFLVDKFYLIESNIKKEEPEYKIIEEYFLN